MKRFVGISSILLLSSILVNTSSSFVLAKETEEQTKVIDTSKEIKEKDSNTEENKSLATDGTSIEDSTIESSAIEEVNGVPQLQDPTKGLMDKIDDSTNKDSKLKEKTSKEGKEKDNPKEDKKKNTQLKSILKINSRSSFNLDDWTYEIDYRNQRIVLNKYIGTSSVVTIDPTYNTFLGDFNIVIAQHALQNDSYISEIHFKKQYGKEGILIWNTDPKNPRPSDSAQGFLSNMPKLKVVDLAGLQTNYISDFSSMFENDKSLTTLNNITGLDVRNGINFSSMFKNCTGLQTVDLLNAGFSNNPNHDSKYFTNFSSMFEGCTNLYEVKIGNIPNNVNMNKMFFDCTVIYAELQFQNSSYLSSNVKGMFSAPYKIDGKSVDGIPLLIYSNSQSFLSNKLQAGDKYYSYDKFAYDGRYLPCVITSSKNGMFADIKEIDGQPYYVSPTSGRKYPVKFDLVNNTYEEKDHWNNAKISMVLTTNGYATNQNPIPWLKQADQTMKLWEQTLEAFPVLKISTSPYYEDDKSRFYNGYFDDQTDDRWAFWEKRFTGIPNYLKNIFLKKDATYAPVNPEMEKGHVIDSKNPNGKVWPENRMPQGRLGFTYQPATVTSDITLQEAGQSISSPLEVEGRTKSAQDDGLFHVGIRDFEKRDDTTNVGPKWTLSAKYHATNPLFKGSYIGFDQNTVRFNMNNIYNKTNQSVPFTVNQLVTSFKSDPDKPKSPMISLKGVTSTSQKKLPDGQTVQLMSSDGTQVQQFYDFTLGNLTLNIPQDHGIKPQKDPAQVGQIDWNLTTGPNGK